MAREQVLFKLVTPTSEKVSIDVDEVMLPGEQGYFGVLPGHTPFLSRIGIGEVVYRIGDKRCYLALSGGFVEVTEDTVTVLAKAAEKPEEIDAERAERAKHRAEERLKGKQLDIDFVRAQAALRRAIMRLKVHETASP